VARRDTSFRNISLDVQLQPVLAEALEGRRLLTGAGFEDRGWVSIIVDETVAPSLTQQLADFKRNLIGDGWRIAPLHTDAPRMLDDDYVWKNTLPDRGPRTVDGPGVEGTFDPQKLAQYIGELQEVKNMIAADKAYAEARGGQLKQVIFVGHVTVPYSGEVQDHEQKSQPTDNYYADFDAKPELWGDYKRNFSNGNDTQHEATTNQPGDSRFDASDVPRDSQVVTVSGTNGNFRLLFKNGRKKGVALTFSGGSGQQRSGMSLTR
jgi:hypothetical protein